MRNYSLSNGIFCLYMREIIYFLWYCSTIDLRRGILLNYEAEKCECWRALTARLIYIVIWFIADVIFYAVKYLSKVDKIETMPRRRNDLDISLTLFTCLHTVYFTLLVDTLITHIFSRYYLLMKFTLFNHNA